jgi:DNA-binding transcriptional MocR family regulator
VTDAQLGTKALGTLLGDWRNAAAGPSYLALFDRIRLLVLDGRIPVDTRLPAERDLAQSLEVSRTMVTAAYRELREAGYTTSLRGSGSVTRLPGGRVPAWSDAAETGFIDFTKATVPAIPGIMEATQNAFASFALQLGSTGLDFFGTPELRASVAARYTARGLPTTSDQIMITTGAQNAIFLLARVLLSRGDRALVELPSYPHAYEALRAAGARLVASSVTVGEGWDAAGLEQAINRANPALGYLMPDFHNPTGESMPGELRERVIDRASRNGTILVADETTGELDIDRVGEYLPFAAYGDAEQQKNVVLIGSVGKTVWAGLRVGWIRADPALVRKLAGARGAGDLGTPVLDQLIVCELLDDYDRILAVRREQLRAGRDRLLRTIEERFPEWDAEPVAGGIATWVGLGAPLSSQLTLAARARGLLITAGPRFGIDGALERFIRIPISYPVPDLDRGLDALHASWTSLLQGGPLPDADLFADVV